MRKKRDDERLFRKSTSTGAVYYYHYYVDGVRLARSTGQRSRQAALNVLRHRVATGQLADPARPKAPLAPPADRSSFTGDMEFVSYAADFFIWDRCPYVRDKTIRGAHVTKGYVAYMRGLLVNYIMPYFSDFPVKAIRRRDVNDWLLTLPGKGLGHGSSNKALSALSIIMEMAVFDELTDSNPCDSVRRFADDGRTRAAFSGKDVARLIAYDYHSTLMTAAVILAATTGMRSGEIRALRWQDVGLNHIDVRHSISDTDGEKAPKSGKPRQVPLRHDVREKLALLYRGAPEAYLFTIDGASPVSKTFFQRGLKKAMKDLGIDDMDGTLTFHSFRHFFNTCLVESGVPTIVVQSVVGHASDGMTKRYLHLEADALVAVKEAQSTIGVV